MMELRSSKRDFQDKPAQYECKKESCDQVSLKTEDQDVSDYNSACSSGSDNYHEYGYDSDSNSESAYPDEISAHVADTSEDPVEFVKKLLSSLKDVSDAIKLPDSSLVLLLQKSKWDANRLITEYFDNPERVLSRIPAKWTCNTRATHTCLVCWDEFKGPNCVAALSCGHTLCPECWSGYLTSSASTDGASILALKCPQPGCDNLVTSDIFESFADSEINTRYKDYMMRSFVDLQSGFQWCPGLACNRAIKLGRFLLDGKEQREMTCPCGMIFCLDCGKEGHLPATCDEKTTWDNNSAENSASEMWKVRHAAPCRKCPNVIQKGEGCKHMTCTCGYQFCWICLQQWGKCGSNCQPISREERLAIYAESSAQNNVRDESLEKFMSFENFEFFFNLREERRGWLRKRKAFFQDHAEEGRDQHHHWLQEGVNKLLSNGNLVLNIIMRMWFMQETLVMDAGDAKSLAFLQLRQFEEMLDQLDKMLTSVVEEADTENMDIDSLNEIQLQHNDLEIRVKELIKSLESMSVGLKGM